MEALKTQQAAAEAEELRLSHLMHDNSMKEENTAARLECRRVYLEMFEYEKAYCKLRKEQKTTPVVEAERYRLMMAESAAKKAFDIVCLGQETYDAYRKAGADYVRLGDLIAEAEYAAKHKK